MRGEVEDVNEGGMGDWCGSTLKGLGVSLYLLNLQTMTAKMLRP